MTDTLFELEAASRGATSLEVAAKAFCQEMPYRQGVYSKRNWGGTLHSLCSYQGKLKPSIAHFLISQFTQPGDVVLDPLAGVGTIPLEARLQGRIGIGSDLSPLADAVCRAKLEVVDVNRAWTIFEEFQSYVERNAGKVGALGDVSFGLNRPLGEYFHPQTMMELIAGRQFFLEQPATTESEIIRSSVLHILHGNRPYALSRNSHPITPFAPTGPTTYKSLIDFTSSRLKKVLPLLQDLSSTQPEGRSYKSDFRDLELEREVDAVITSPPFSKSLRFWSSNWMRLWFAGWTPEDFKSVSDRFIEVGQKRSFDVYQDFAGAMHRCMKPGGLLIMHLGETSAVNMAEAVAPQLEAYFDVEFVGRESVLDTETHGIMDKGSTIAHWYLFATAKKTGPRRMVEA